MSEPLSVPSPADARPHAPWPRWKIVLAYVVLAAVACTSIWLVDRSATQARKWSTESVTEHR